MNINVLMAGIGGMGAVISGVYTATANAIPSVGNGDWGMVLGPGGALIVMAYFLNRLTKERDTLMEKILTNHDDLRELHRQSIDMQARTVDVMERGIDYLEEKDDGN